MKKRIGFIAIGQAGGNIGKLFESKGFSVLYVNTSQEDLDTLDHVKFSYHINNGEGCNKDRNKAKNLVIDDYDNIANEIDTKILADMLFVIFASGGGTGSGTAPMLIDMLISDGKQVGVITVIPSEGESIRSQINCYEAFSELVNIQGTGTCFIIDNNRGNKLDLNKRFVDKFCKFLEVSSHKSVKGIIDKAELLETLGTHGMSYVIDSKPGTEDLLSNIQNSPYAPLESDLAIKYIAISVAGDTNLDDLQKKVGTPLDTYVTYNDTANICCLVGLSYPQTRLDSVYNLVNNSKETIVKNLNASKESKLKTDVDFLQSMEKPTVMKDEVKPKSRRDIMSKYIKG
ncbi:hypothetical protein [Anaerosporobacter sp.]